ncbi:MAG: choice-of-anchor D domain-containing protein, partial [Candidatus Marinimicrobia bacterium]|nr:choice-of-anchor D domain-containing protein [Candidatus Neomarinimicrobiota bacterium]
MQNPSEVSDPLGEWVEIHSRWFTPVHLKDFILADDGTDAHTIATDVAIPAGGYAVLASNADTATNAGLIADYEFSGFSLGNSSDEVVLSDAGGTELDRVEYDNGATFPDPSGASMELIAPFLDNAQGTNWATGVTPYGDGDLGSPGRRNDAFSGQIVISDSTFNFGGVVSGEDISDTLIISNMGVRRLMVDSITVSLPEYSLTPTSAMLEIGDSVEIFIAYAPNAAGVNNDNVQIYSDDPINPLVTVPLYGVGISDVPDIIVMTADNDSLSAYNFPYTRIGSPRTFSMDVINIGAEDLEIDEIVITGDDNAFSVDVSSLYLELYDTTAVTVTFNPPSNGTYAATLSLTSNDPDEALYTIAFDGIASQYIIFYVPDEIATIQAALDSALAGDTIHVAPGTYGANLTFPTSDLVLRGAGADSTILTGGDSSVVLTVDGGQSSATIISGLTIRNGSGTNGGGVLIDGGSNPVIRNILFYDNSASHGAGVYVSGFSNPTFDHTTFVLNSASTGGAGVSVAGGSSVAINNSILSANNGSAIEVINGSETTTYSIVDGGNAGTGNLDTIPQFENPGSGDFHLQWGSPAIDSGDPGSDSDPDGTVTDMGVFYYDQSYQPPNAPTGLAFTPAAAEVTLQWTASPESDVTSYIIYKGLTTDQLDSIDLVNTPSISYVDQDFDPSTVAYYQVAAVDTSQLLSERSE